MARVIFFYTLNLLRISGFSIVWNNVAKNFTDLLNKWHFLAFNRNPEDRSRSNTLPKFTIISSNLFLIIMVSSSKTRHMSYCNPTSFISLSGAQQSPNGITLNWNIPLWVKKTLFYFCLQGHVLPVHRKRINGREPTVGGQLIQGIVNLSFISLAQSAMPMDLSNVLWYCIPLFS